MEWTVRGPPKVSFKASLVSSAAAARARCRAATLALWCPVAWRDKQLALRLFLLVGPRDLWLLFGVHQ